MYIIRVFNITTTIKRQTIDFENYLVEMWKKKGNNSHVFIKQIKFNGFSKQ